MDHFRAVQEERLKQLSLASNSCIGVLQQKLGAAGERLEPQCDQDDGLPM